MPAIASAVSVALCMQCMHLPNAQSSCMPRQVDVMSQLMLCHIKSYHMIPVLGLSLHISSHRAVIAKQNLDGYMAKLEQELAVRKQTAGGAATTMEGAASDGTAQCGNGTPADDWAQEATASRVEACLQKRLQLASCHLVDGLTVNPATCQADWDDMTLSGLLYRS
jgi:hypothetical protein